MTNEQISRFVESLGGVLTLRPAPGDGTPQVSWGDLFFYYAPDAVVPPGQPFATVVTKDYPDEPSSGLGSGIFRVNIDAGRRVQAQAVDVTSRDQVLPHPMYGRLGWGLHRAARTWHRRGTARPAARGACRRAAPLEQATCLAFVETG